MSEVQLLTGEDGKYRDGVARVARLLGIVQCADSLV